MSTDSPQLFGEAPPVKAEQPKIVPVLVPMPAAKPYSYAVPEGMIVGQGAIVQVPLGPRMVPGLVWASDPNSKADDVAPKKLRPIEQVFDCPPISADMMRFIEWVATYTLTPPGLVARMVLRVPAAFDPAPAELALKATGFEPDRMTDARRRVLALAKDDIPWSKSGLANAASVTPSVVDGLIKSGAFETVAMPPRPIVARPDYDFAKPDLSGDQAKIVNDLYNILDTDRFSCALLDGVTGAGKTEVYFEAIAHLLEKDPDAQILVLLPEIALTGAVLTRFEDRFGAPPAQWHSEMTPKQRERTWRQVAEGTIRVVAGARSALFLPFQNLKLIIVDEEHDGAYKQEDGVCYHARDMSVVRGSIGHFPVILASATPSIETRFNALRGRYQHLKLPARFNDVDLPDLHAIDLRANPPERGKFLSPLLLEEMAKTHAKGEQSLLFLNRRGYAPLTLCRSCGHRFECNNCSAWLVEHRFRGQLQCHHCGHHERVPESCPECGTFDHLVACGPGIERIAEEVVAQFPDQRIIVLSSDMMGGVKRLRIELDAIAKGEADIIIGTQLVAKGHNFPLLSLVGIIDADIGLANGDPRAAERTFQLLSQVTGRAGRSGLKSKGLIQTYQPQHPVMAALVKGDREKFYANETVERERGFLPPFCRLGALIISGEDKQAAETHARALRNASPPSAPDGPRFHVLGPAEAPLSLIRGRYRFRLLVQTPKNADMQSYIAAMIKAAPRPRGTVRVSIDIDPQSFL